MNECTISKTLGLSTGSDDTLSSDFTSLSCNSDNIDINFSFVSKTPPSLPLQEELLTSGFEVVRGTRGTGKRAVLKESLKKQHDRYKHDEDKDASKAISCEKYFSSHLIDKARKRSFRAIAESKVVQSIHSIMTAFSRSINASTATDDLSELSCSSTSRSSETDNGFFEVHVSNQSESALKTTECYEASHWWFKSHVGSESSSMCFAPSLGTACTSSAESGSTDISRSNMLLS